MAKFVLGDTLADVLGGVSGPDRGPEQIVMIELALIDADEKNFYSVEGVEELAANIELIGLLDPLRVRENPDKPGRYLIVSGHRRRAALGTLCEEDPEKWSKAPCIVEPPAASPELQELRLIYANADTRKMTSADLSAQTERVEMLLYKLKEQGMEFPGRMRDHVADACKISGTKLAVLKAIRNNMIPELFAFYEKGEINETCAYELQKLPKEGQKAIADSCKRTGAAFIKSWGCERCVENAEKYMAARKCQNGDDCDHHAVRFVKTLRSKYSWAYCNGGCCVSCRVLKDCDHACKKAKAKKAEKKAEDKAQKEDRKKEADLLQKKEQKRKREVRQAQARRVLPLIDAAGLGDDEQFPGKYYYSYVRVSEIRKAAAGDFPEGINYYGDDHLILPDSTEALSKWANKLGCSLDYLAGRTENPKAAPAARPLQFRTGTPDHDCVCWCAFSFGLGSTGCQAARWKGGKWWLYSINADIDAECVGWIELPDYEGVLRNG